jgi:hypothetical protein
MSSSFAVTFAGVPGSSKTIISNYLSVKFNLPVFNNDQLRFEVKEDMMVANINEPKVLAEYEKRYKERFEGLLLTRHPMLLDGSVDRRWSQTKLQLQQNGYSWLIISMDLSEEFLKHFFVVTGRPKFLAKLPKYIADHDNFNRLYSGDVGLSINDEKFTQRIKLSATALQHFLSELEINNPTG